MSNLAQVYKSVDKLPEAEQLWTDVLQAKRDIFGDKHPQTLYSLVVLGVFYLEHQRPGDAEPLFRESLAGCRAALNRNHDTTEMALAGLAVIYGSKAELEKLEPVLKEAAQISLAKNGPDDLNTGKANWSLAMLYWLRNEYAKAEPCLRECLAFQKRNGAGPGNPHFNELQYGVCLLAQGREMESKPHLLAAYNGIRPGQENAPPLESGDVGRLLYRILRLRDTDGRPLSQTILAVIHKDPKLEGLLLDLQFPGKLFESP